MIRELDRGTATRREHVKRIDGRLSALKGKHSPPLADPYHDDSQ